MASLTILARLFANEGEAFAGQLVTVEAFALSSGKWGAVAEAETNREGALKATVDLSRLNAGEFAPALRLVSEALRGQVIAAGAALGPLQGRAGDILADFGEVDIRRGTRPDGAETAGDAVLRARLDPRVSAEIETMHAINLDNSAKLTEKDRVIATREHELSLKRAELQSALVRASEAENRLAEAESGSRGEPADIDAVVATIGTKIGAASTALKTSSNPFRIGAIRLDLKGSLAGDGRIFLGGDRADGSGFSVEMAPESDRTRGEVQVTVPDVTGLTRSAAGRVLRSVGLRLSAASQAMAAGAATHGHSLRQTPAAGGPAPHGSDVLVVFATVSDG